MAEESPEKKAKQRENDKLKQQTVLGYIQQINELKSSLDDKQIELIPLKYKKHKFFAIIDKKFATWVKRKKWHVNVQKELIHPRTTIFGKNVTLSNFIVRLDYGEKGMIKKPNGVTFKNKLSLDCRIENLNHLNERSGVLRKAKPRRGTKSAYRGVRQTEQDEALGLWRADIADRELRVHCGRYPSEEEAALVRDAAALILHADDAMLNFSISEIPQEAHEEARVRVEEAKERLRVKKRKEAETKREKEKKLVEAALEEGKTDLQIIYDLNIDRRKYNRILKKLRETQPKKPY